MSMRTEDPIYNVDVCGCTGVACIYCNPGPCGHRRTEKRHHPWGSTVDVAWEDRFKVPKEDLSNSGGAEPQMDPIQAVRGRML